MPTGGATTAPPLAAAAGGAAAVTMVLGLRALGRKLKGARGRAAGAEMAGPKAAGPPTVVKDLVLLGGGHSHVAVLRSFGMSPVEAVQVTLVARDILTPYSGMLPGYVAGHYTHNECHIDLQPLAQFARARVVHAEAVGLDVERRLVKFKDRPPLKYDVLSINVGITPARKEVSGASEYATPVKPIDGFVRQWDRLRAKVKRAEDKVHIAVVGGGAGGVELALAIHHRLAGEWLASGKPKEYIPEVSLFSRGEILHQHNGYSRDRFREILRERGVHVHENAAVEEVRHDIVHLQNGEVYHFDECLWCTQGEGAAWLEKTGLKLHASCVAVNECLQSESHPDVFAAGDVASCAKHPRPKAGVFAVRQGPPLAHNLRSALLGKDLVPFKPQGTYLSLISTGNKFAVATKGKFGHQGAWLWNLKDKIDRNWMAQYGEELPSMPEPEVAPPEAAAAAGPEALACLARLPMRCGGCGAKVGSTVLSRVLRRLALPTRPEVLVGVDSPDDAAVVRPPAGKVLVQTVDFFRAFVKDPYVFGQIAANHALGDCHAMGADAISALAVAVVPYGLESKVEENLHQMLAGACDVLREANCALVGGHSSEGTELALGFAVNGAVDPEAMLTKSAVREGQTLVLTKPVGTGTIFAADMRAKAKGPWVTGAMESMKQSNYPGALCLQRHGATACTDVTGFGLLGHLVEMVKPAALGAIVEVSQVPLLEGALECVVQGIFSSLQPENRRLARAVANPEVGEALAGYPLLFDPQTAGGLLASLPADRVPECLDELRRLGYRHTRIVGRIVKPSDSERMIEVRR